MRKWEEYHKVEKFQTVNGISGAIRFVGWFLLGTIKIITLSKIKAYITFSVELTFLYWPERFVRCWGATEISLHLAVAEMKN